MSDKKNDSFEGLTDIGRAEEMIGMFRRDHPDDDAGVEDMLSQMLEELDRKGDSIKLSGTENDFHNFAVSITKILKDYDAATTIVSEGLKLHPYNTDLLADAIEYGSSSSTYQKNCGQWYRTLKGIDKKNWTWRSFSFSIDYLMSEYAKSSSVLSFDEILTLADQYQSYIPDREDAWLSKFNIYDQTNQREEGIHVLEEAMELFDSCPKCWLRYADIMMDRGKYENAEPVIKKILRDPKSSESVNMAYVYFLDSQCKMRRLINSDDYDEGIFEEKAVRKVYKSLQLALKSLDLRDNVRQRAEEYITRLEVETDIPYPENWR